MGNLSIRQTIIQARKCKGWTQDQLATHTGLSLRTIQRIEKGNVEISGYSLQQISVTLDIPIEELILSDTSQNGLKTKETGNIKTLYLVSLSFLLHPILGLLVPGSSGFLIKIKQSVIKVILTLF